MLMLVSPAKNLNEQVDFPTNKLTQPEFLEQAAVLAALLKKQAPHDLSKLMGISDKLGQLNYDRYQAWRQPFTKDNALPAVLAFNGDVYQGLQANTFTDEDFTFAQARLRILSGLYGCLRPLDLMQAYRLEMGTKLANAEGKDLYAYWGEQITASLNKQLAAVKAESLINLASNEYFKSVKRKQINAEIIEPVFKDWKNGQYKIISFFAKKARGLMANYIIKNRITVADDIIHFDCAGYQYDEGLSKPTQWVFTRKEA